MKPYEEYRETLTKDKKSKAMVQVSQTAWIFQKFECNNSDMVPK